MPHPSETEKRPRDDSAQEEMKAILEQMRQVQAGEFGQLQDQAVELAEAFGVNPEILERAIELTTPTEEPPLDDPTRVALQFITGIASEEAYIQFLRMQQLGQAIDHAQQEE